MPLINEYDGQLIEQTVTRHQEAMATTYRGLINLHALELLQSDRFKRTGRLTPADVHRIRKDLDKLTHAHPLDATCELILQKADALDLEIEAQKDSTPQQRSAASEALSDARAGSASGASASGTPSSQPAPASTSTHSDTQPTSASHNTRSPAEPDADGFDYWADWHPGKERA